MRIAVLGRTHWLLDAAHHALSLGHEIGLVATARAQPEYRAKETDFATLAAEAGADFHLDPDVNAPEFVEALRASGAHVAISVNWPTLIRRAACEALPSGVLNGHAGDLPRFRGNACPNWAILTGEPHVGVCIHGMDPDALDAGPIFARRRLPLDENTYIADVYAWLDRVFPQMFAEAIPRAGDPDFTPEDQSLSGVRPLRCQGRRPEDGLIDWGQTAQQICRLVRASSSPLPGAFTFLEQEMKVTVWRARETLLDYDVLAMPGQIMGRGPRGGVLVACGSGVLEIEEAVVADGRLLPAANRFRLTNAGPAGS